MRLQTVCRGCEGGSFRNENPSPCVTYSKDRLNAFTLLYSTLLYSTLLYSTLLYCFQSRTVGLSDVEMFVNFHDELHVAFPF